MKEKEIVAKFKQMPWEVWLHRRFHPFVTYLMMKGALPECFERATGVKGQYPIVLYDTEDWYGTDEMFALGAEQAAVFLIHKNIFELTSQCEAVLEKGRIYIPQLIASGSPPMEIFENFIQFFEPANAYIWVAHASEPYYHALIRDAVRPLVAESEVETYIGDISFPSKSLFTINYC